GQMPQGKSGVLSRTPFEDVERLRRCEIFEQQDTLASFGVECTVIQARGSENNVLCHFAIKSAFFFIDPVLMQRGSDIRIERGELRDNRRRGASLSDIIVEPNPSDLSGKAFSSPKYFDVARDHSGIGESTCTP